MLAGVDACPEPRARSNPVPVGLEGASPGWGDARPPGTITDRALFPCGHALWQTARSVQRVVCVGPPLLVRAAMGPHGSKGVQKVSQEGEASCRKQVTGPLHSRPSHSMRAPTGTDGPPSATPCLHASAWCVVAGRTSGRRCHQTSAFRPCSSAWRLGGTHSAESGNVPRAAWSSIWRRTSSCTAM